MCSIGDSENLRCSNSLLNNICYSFRNFIHGISNRNNEEESDMTDLPLLDDNVHEIEMSYSPVIQKHKNILEDVMIKISKNHIIQQITVKYPTSEKYINLSFSHSGNPKYVQLILDTYFINDENNIIALNKLFEDLEISIMERTMKNRKTASWLADNAEWIKFSYINNQIIPIGYKKYKI